MARVRTHGTAQSGTAAERKRERELIEYLKRQEKTRDTITYSNQLDEKEIGENRKIVLENLSRLQNKR
jgi:hypothetical protein